MNSVKSSFVTRISFVLLLAVALPLAGCKLKAGSDPGTDLERIKSDLNKSLSIEGICSAVAQMEETYRCQLTPLSEHIDESELVWHIDDELHNCSWLEVSPATGQISGTPKISDFGGCTAAIKLSSPEITSPTFQIKIDVPSPKVSVSISSCLGDANVDKLYNCHAVASALINQPTFTYGKHQSSSCGEWVSINPSTGNISGSPQFSDVGTCELVVATSTLNFPATLTKFTINVPNPDITITTSCSSNAVVEKGYACSIGAESQIYENPEFSFSLDTSNTCNWASLNSLSKSISGTPSLQDIGYCDLVIKVVLQNEISSKKIIRVVTPTPNIIIRDNCPEKATVATNYNCQITSEVENYKSGMESADLKLDLSNTCEWATLDQAGNISGTPLISHAGSCDLVIEASVGNIIKKLNTISINVPTPTLALTSNCSKNGYLKSLYACQVSATTTNHPSPSLTYKVADSSTCSWINTTLFASEQKISGTPSQIDHVGTCNMDLVVRLDNYLEKISSITITTPKPTVNSNLDICPTQLAIGNSYSCSVTATSNDITNLSFNWSKDDSDTCSWIAVSQTGSITGQASVENAGICNLSLNATISGTDYKYTFSKNVKVLENDYTAKTIISAASSSTSKFGSSVYSEGNLLIVGEPYGSNPKGNSGVARLFEKSNGNWSESVSLIPEGVTSASHFGASVLIQGSFIFVSDIYANNSKTADGRVNVFKKVGATWVETSYLSPSMSLTSLNYGSAMAADRNTVVVGSQRGLVDIYKISGDTVSFIQTLTPSNAPTGNKFGKSVSISNTKMVIGDPYQNVAYVFSFNGQIWIEKQKILGLPGSGFGTAVSIHENHLAISAPSQSNHGRVHMYKDSDGTFVSNGAPLEPFKLTSGMKFGSSLDLSSNNLVIGAQNYNGYRGVAFLFKSNWAGEWNAAGMFSSSANSPESGDKFGASIRVDDSSGDVFIGAPAEDGYSSNNGAITYFKPQVFNF